MLLSVLIVCGSLGDKNLKMAAPLVAILAPESSYYLVVIYIELPFHSLCKQFIIISFLISYLSEELVCCENFAFSHNISGT